MANIVLWMLIVFLVNVGYAQENIGILHGVDTESTNSNDYCIMYNPAFSPLPETLDEAVIYEIANYSESFLCNDTSVDPLDLKARAAFVERGNCSFSEKAFLAQHYGAKALVVISKSGINEPVANEASDYDKINISVSLLASGDFQNLMELGPNVRAQLYAPPTPHIDWNLVVIWILATGTVFVGGLWSGFAKHQQYMKRRRPSKRQDRASEDSRGEDDEEKGEDNFDMSPTTIIVFVFLMCGMLVSLYFFYDYLVYIVIAMFALASCVALYSSLKPLLLKLTFIGDCRIPTNRLPVLRRRPEVRRIILFLMCAGVAIWWGVERNKSYAWVLQDVLGIVFCVHMMKTIRLPSLMACSILLGLLFVYDIFFVFITPLFTKSGQSVMVDVATGGSSKSGEMLPMVLKVPRITQSALSMCQLPFSLLGFGDIIVPGLLVSYCHGFDLKVNSKRIYFIASLIAYGVGLVLTFIALALMKEGQPALLYLVPCTLLTTLLVGACRRELRHLWTGKLKSSAKEETPASIPSGNGTISPVDQPTANIGSSHNSIIGASEMASEESDCEQPLLVNK